MLGKYSKPSWLLLGVDVQLAKARKMKIRITFYLQLLKSEDSTYVHIGCMENHLFVDKSCK